MSDTGTTQHAVTLLHARETALLVALLAGKSIADAAKDAKVSRRTGYRIFERENFQRAFAAAKTELLGSAIAKLHTNAGAFIGTLHDLATDPKVQASARVGASREGLNALYRGIEIFDIEERLRKLETLAGEGQK